MFENVKQETNNQIQNVFRNLKENVNKWVNDLQINKMNSELKRQLNFPVLKKTL